MKVVKKLTSLFSGRPDDLFVTCVSFEERCLGIPRILSEDYRFKNGFIFAYDDPSEKRTEHLGEMQHILQARGHIQRIETAESDPLPALGQLGSRLQALNFDRNRSVITLDITTFTKRHLLLLLKTVDNLDLSSRLRIYYSEPRDYVTELFLPMSMGIRNISPITGFVGHAPLSKPTLLVVLLGYEGDRAKAIYENLDPNEVLLVIPRPAYHPEWEGRTEEMNKHLIRMVGQASVRYTHSQDALLVAKQLEDMLVGFPLEKWRCSVAPLGTKPQTLGVYLFWRKNRGKFSLIYAQPLRHNESFFSTGIGRTLELLTPSAD
jgi:hypothetical protein